MGMKSNESICFDYLDYFDGRTDGRPSSNNTSNDNATFTPTASQTQPEAFIVSDHCISFLLPPYSAAILVARCIHILLDGHLANLRFDVK